MTNGGDFEAAVLAFERAWQQGAVPAISDFLLSLDSENQHDRRRLLVELVCLDLEYRWQSASKSDKDSDREHLDDYIQSFPELKSLDVLPLELIGEEYRVRHRWGDRPTHRDFLARFKQRHEEISTLIRSIDDELRNEDESPSMESPASASVTVRPPALPDPRAPLADSDYLLQRLIGAGRMGKVYRAWQRSLDRPVAVKFLRKSFLQHAEIVERFVAEARTVAKLSHPGIVGIHGLGRTPMGGYFIAMDLVDGRDLARIVNKDGPCAMSEVVGWMIQSCDAVDHAHQRGIIHCDLKPGNLLLDQGGKLRITDFGLARSTLDDSNMEDCIEGTAPFMAPEQVSRYWGQISPRTDVYGLGAVLFTLLTGEAPWQGRTLSDVLARVVSAEPLVAPQISRSDIPSELNAICVRCLSRSPKDRFASARELRSALTAMTG